MLGRSLIVTASIARSVAHGPSCLGLSRALFVGAVSAFSVTAAASDFGEETVKLNLGTFVSDFDTSIGLTGPNGGGGIDLEDDVGLDSNQKSTRGGLSWRVAPRHRVLVGFYDFQRSSTATSQRSIEIDDPDDGLIVINAGASVTTCFD